MTSPHIKQYPPPEKIISNVVRRLRKYDLTKTEALTLINLGLGLPRLQPANANLETNGNVTEGVEVKDESGEASNTKEGGDPTSETMMSPGAVEPNFRALADCVIEDIGERFPGDEGEEKIEQILSVLEECIEEVKQG